MADHGPGRYSTTQRPRLSSLDGRRERAEQRAATTPVAKGVDFARYGYTVPGSMNSRKLSRG